MKIREIVEAIAVIVLGVMIPLMAFSFMLNNAPSGFAPGDSVAILTGNTVSQNGYACQENNLGMISETGPEGEEFWHKPDRFLLPQKQYVAVKGSDGTVAWYDIEILIKLPASLESFLCK